MEVVKYITNVNVRNILKFMLNRIYEKQKPAKN